MNFVEKYRLYRNLIKTTPSNVTVAYKPDRYLRITDWDCNNVYSVHHVYDTEYDWHSMSVSDYKNKTVLAEFNGWLARRIYDRVQKSL